MHQSTTRKHAVNVLMSDAEYEQLRALANDGLIPMGLVIRQSIAARYNMTFNAKASCANGRLCLCPQMQPYEPKRPPTDAA